MLTAHSSKKNKNEYFNGDFGIANKIDAILNYISVTFFFHSLVISSRIRSFVFAFSHYLYDIGKIGKARFFEDEVMVLTTMSQSNIRNIP